MAAAQEVLVLGQVVLEPMELLTQAVAQVAEVMVNHQLKMVELGVVV
jgi:hypothetical protein